jgi:transcriptional regulator with XRE-family HTH domain
VGALGARLKTARLARHLPMRTVARTAGISVTHISQIERGRNCPTIGALARIAGALGVSLHHFLEAEPRPEIQYCLRGTGPEARSSSGGARLHSAWISDGICGGRIHVVRFTLEPHASAESADRIRIPAMQLYYLLEGQLVVQIENAQYTFNAGDALVIQPSLQSRLVNPGPATCEIITVLRNEQGSWIPGPGEAAARCLETTA